MPSKIHPAEPKTSQDLNTSAVSPMTALSYGMAGHAGTAFVDAGVSALASGYQQRQQRKLMREQYELQRKATRDQMVDERESYIKAGLNPNLLANGGFTPIQPSVPSPAQQTVSGKNLDTKQLSEQSILANTLLEQKASVENLEAQTQGQKLKNEEQEIINDRLTDEDNAADMNMREYVRESLSELPDGEFKRKLQERLDNPEIRFTAGSMRGNQHFIELLRSKSQYGAEEFENLVTRQVAQMMYNSDDVLAAKASLPYAEIKLLNAQIHEISSLIGKYASEIDLNAANTDVAKQQVKRMAQDIAMTAYELESRQLNDSRYLAKHGRGSDLALNMLGNALELGGDIAKVYLGARAFRGGSAALPKTPDYGSNTFDLEKCQKP